jgi:hypothetical protein
MGIDVALTLKDLQCVTQDRGSDGSAPYVWPASVFINTSTAKVTVLTWEARSLARLIIQNGMHSGDTAPIPPSVAVLGRRFDDDPAQYKFIATIVLWEKRDLSDDSMAAGFLAYGDALQVAIEANLGGLASPDPDVNKKAVDAVKASVHQQVSDAIENTLTDVEKAEIKAGILTPDSVIDSSSTVIPVMSDQSFTITFGNTPDNQSNHYIIDAQLQLKTVICEAELNAVNQDQVVLNQLDAQLAELKKELAQAPPAEKPGIEQDIRDFAKNEIAPAKAKLSKDTVALNQCRQKSTTRAA